MLISMPHATSLIVGVVQAIVKSPLNSNLVEDDHSVNETLVVRQAVGNALNVLDQGV